MHFRLSIIVVLTLVIVAGAYIAWQSWGWNDLKTGEPVAYAEDTDALSDFQTSISEFEAEANFIAQLDVTLDDVILDAAGPQVTESSLDQDEQVLTAVESFISEQAGDRAAVNGSFDDLQLLTQ